MLIIADGADVTVTGGIGLDNGASLTIYAQSADSSMGKLTVQSTNVAAAIGGYDKVSCGDIIINDGSISAQGGDKGAGIGNGFQGSCGSITINGGSITAQGDEDGAGIGTGYQGSCPDGISLGGAFVKAVKGANADAHIGQSSGKAVNVVADKAQYDSGEDGDFRTINCQFFQTGTKEYYLNKLDNVYYSDMPFTKGTKIGGSTELNVWLSSTTASVFSEGNGVIIAVVSAAVVIAAGALVIVKKKKKA